MSNRYLKMLMIAAGALSSGVALAHHGAFKASRVIGATWHNPRGEGIGEVKDLVIENDDVLSAIVSVGGKLGVGDHVVAVPARALMFSHDDATWHIEMTKEQLVALPSFDASKVLGDTAKP